MLTIRDQIDQLRLELTGCLLTRRERVQANAELKRLLAAQAERDRALDMSASGRPPIASMSGGRRSGETRLSLAATGHARR